MTIKKYQKLQLSAIILLFCSFIASDNRIETPVSIEPSQEKANFSPCKIKNTTFKTGEKLTFKAYYNWNFVWMSAGEAVAKVSDDKKGNHNIVVKGRTYSSYDWFYRVRDHFETTIDKKTLRPSTCMRYIEEGKFRLYDKVDFDFEKEKAKSFRGKSKEKAGAREYDVDGCMHDLVSMIYFFRNVNFKKLKKGEEMPMQIFMDREAWNVKLRYEGKKIISVKGKGKHLAYKISTRVSAGDLFDDNSSVAVYVSADKNQIPLKVKLELSIGSVQVVLKDYKGLKYPYQAKYVK
ncbi:MAG: DUF3108 domain-containing protein, partial [Saprospiraceae bacterium]